MQAEGMKVRRLKIQHFKKIKNVDVYASEHCNEIVGPNESGKSSFLDAIKTAIGGAKLSPDKPITDGQGRGEIFIELDGGLQITRKFKEGSGMTTKIQARDGSKWGQKGLDNLLSAFTVDPLEFSRMDKKKQTAVIEKLAGQEHLDKAGYLNTKYDECFQERAYEKRKLAEMGSPEPVSPCEPVDGKAVAEELDRAMEFNRTQVERARNIDDIKSEIRSLDAQIEELEKMVAKKKRERLETEMQLEQAPKPEPSIDIVPIKEKLQTVVEANTKYNQYRKYLESVETIEKQREKVDGCEIKVQEALKEKMAHAAKVKLPVEGLTWGPEGIRVNGIPFEQLASSVKINISARIGMAVKSGLRIMLVQDGSLLDQAKFAELVELARAHNYQLWIETVDRAHSQEAIYLNEGAVIPQPAVSAGERIGATQ
jgi:hypothetical protein